MYSIFEAELTTKERKELKESQFGIPEDRKYPLTDANHVRSAISYFSKAPVGKKRALAKRIYEAAKKYGVTISPDSEVAQYLNGPIKTRK